MFKVDSKFDDMEPGGRKAARDAELRPLMEDFGGMGAGPASPSLAEAGAAPCAAVRC